MPISGRRRASIFAISAISMPDLDAAMGVNRRSAALSNCPTWLPDDSIAWATA